MRPHERELGDDAAAEEPPPSAATPVFVDESGRRHVHLRVLAWGLGVLVGGGALLILAALATGVLGADPDEDDLLPHPDLPTPASVSTVGTTPDSGPPESGTPSTTTTVSR